MVDIEPLGERRAHVLDTVRKRERQLENAIRTGLLHVIAANRDRIEFRHLASCEVDDIGDDSHTGFGGIDIGIPNHELLEDVVLDCPRQLGCWNALLLCRHDETGQDRQDSPIHRHRNSHFIQRDGVEENLHILDAIDGNPGLSDVAGHARMIGVISTMRGEVEGHGEALLAGCEIGPIEGIRFFGGGKARVLANRPGTIRIHRGPRSPQEGE